MFTVFIHALGQASASPAGLLAYLALVAAFTFLTYSKLKIRNEGGIKRPGPHDPPHGMTERGFLSHRELMFRYLAYAATLLAVLILSAMTLSRVDKMIDAHLRDADKAVEVAQQDLKSRIEQQAQQTLEAQKASDRAERQLQQQIRAADDARTNAEQTLKVRITFLAEQLRLAEKKIGIDNLQVQIQVHHDEQQLADAKESQARQRAKEREPKWLTASRNIPPCHPSGCWENYDICGGTLSGWKVTGDSRNVYDPHGFGFAKQNWGPVARGPAQMCMGFGQNSDTWERNVSFDYKIVLDE